MRRNVGIGAINKKALAQTKFNETGNKIEQNQIEQMTKQMELFRENLEQFSIKYKNEIKSNSSFRKQFQDMCANIGVDPLASSKGFWSDVLGIGDFYYELAIQIIEICNANQERTGGLIYLDLVLNKLNKLRNKKLQQVTLDDCLRALKKLNILGNGFTLIQMKNNRLMIQSIPDELSTDHTQILQLAELNKGFLNVKQIEIELKWNLLRIENVLNFMIKESIIWIDLQSNTTITYYFPSFFMDSC